MCGKRKRHTWDTQWKRKGIIYQTISTTTHTFIARTKERFSISGVHWKLNNLPNMDSSKRCRQLSRWVRVASPSDVIVSYPSICAWDRLFGAFLSQDNRKRGLDSMGLESLVLANIMWTLNRPHSHPLHSGVTIKYCKSFARCPEIFPLYSLSKKKEK